MSNLLNGMNVIVVGAGPAGLTFAKKASAHGGTVHLFEAAGDPRSENPGYTERSFNLTLNNAGRAALDDPEIYTDGNVIIGRAMHDFTRTGKTRYASYGEGDSARLVGIHRPVLRRRLAQKAEESGVKLHFRSRVRRINPNSGEVIVQTSSKTISRSGDLLVIADGLHSIADNFIEKLPHGTLNKSVDPYSYVTVQFDKEICKGLSLSHIHFWHEIQRETISIGVPNEDGTVAVLIISKFKGAEPGQSPFATFELSRQRLKSDFSQLLKLDPGLPSKLVGRKNGAFYYKYISNYAIGKKTVVVGDAGNAVPPWAAIGANSALYCADALARFLLGCNGNITDTMKHYEEHVLKLQMLVSDFVNEHGNFLIKRVTERPEEHSSSPMLGRFVNRVIAEHPPPGGVELLSFPD